MSFSIPSFVVFFFSAEMILTKMISTPWLTTRRRTCPICKGDVVRSLARGSWAGPRYEPYRDDGDDEDDDDDQAAEGSGYRSSSGDEDIEQGIAEGEHAEARRPNWQNNLFGMFPSGIGGRRRAPSPSPPSDDRRA